MLRFSVSNLHADSLANALSGQGPWPATTWKCTIVQRDEGQFGVARLETDAPRDAVESAMAVLRETDSRCSAIDFEHQQQFAITVAYSDRLTSGRHHHDRTGRELFRVVEAFGSADAIRTVLDELMGSRVPSAAQVTDIASITCSPAAAGKHHHEIASSSGGPRTVDGATVYNVVQRCTCGSKRVLQGPDAASLRTRVDWHGGIGDADDIDDELIEPAPGWEDRAVERAKREGLFDPRT